MTTDLAVLPNNALAELDGLPTPRRYWAAIAIGLALAMSVLDASIANIALPTIARDLQASASASIWVINAFQLAVISALLPLAALGEIIGYRKIYLWGLGLFTVASLGCALSRSMDVLAAARVAQGLGAAGIMGINGALVRYTYPHARLGHAIGLNALIVAVSAAIGPTVAAAILAVAPWPWLFGVNVPIGLVAMVVGAIALPHTPRSDRRFDWQSALLNATAFGLLVSGVEVWGRGFALAGIAEIAGALIAGAFLTLRELSRPAPLVPFDLLRIRIFALSVAAAVSGYAALMLAFVSLPFHLQIVAGRSAVETGLLMTPWPVAAGIAAMIAGRLADRWPAGVLGAVGLALMSTGLALLAWLPPHATTLEIVLRVAACGMGFGLFQSPNSRAIMAAAPKQRSGAAGGMLATARLIGQTAGAATVAIIFRVTGSEATNLVLGVAAVVAAVAALISLSRSRA